MTNPESGWLQPEQNDLSDIRCLHLRNIIDGYSDDLVNDDKTNPRISKAVKALLEENQKNNSKYRFFDSNSQSQLQVLSAIRYYAKRGLSTRMLDELDIAVLANTPTNLKFSTMNSGRLGLGNIANMFVDPDVRMAEEFKIGMQEGVRKVLDLIEGSTPLLVYTRNLIESIEADRRHTLDGPVFVIPTSIAGVKTSYFYPSHSSRPEISLVVNSV